MTVRPLINFFAWRHPDRVQLVFLVLYLIGVVHLCFFSLADRGPLEARHWMLSTWLPLLMPVWVIDGEMNRRRSPRVFVWPRSKLRAVISGYLAGRYVRAIVLALLLVLLTYNVWLMRDSDIVWVLLSCALLAMFIASFALFWNILAGSKTAYPSTYAAAVVVLWVLSRLSDSAVVAEVAQTVLIPVWLLDPVSAAANMQEPLRVLQGLGACLVWTVASCGLMHRSYR